MWRLGGIGLDAARTNVETALDAGCTLFDTADIYGLGTEAGFGAAESLLGRVLRAAPELRARMVLATKAGIEPPQPYNSSASYLIAACEASLRRLGVEQVDLLQIHRPDLLSHPAEVAAAFEMLHRQGKIRAAGVSNYTVPQVRALLQYLPLPLASMQPEFSVLSTGPLDDGLLDLAMERGIAVLAWSPLAGGRIAGTATSNREARVIAVLDALAGRYEASRTAIAFAWLMRHPTRPVPLVGSQSPGRIRDAATASAISLTRRDWYDVLEASRGAAMP
jgi:predicted oxidoreductase